LDIHYTLTSIEERLDSMEIDLARQQGSRDDDARRLSSEMAVMKARVEDALDAFARTAEELREMAKAFDKRLAKKADPAGGAIATLRREVEAKIEGVTAGIGDVLESLAGDLGARIEGIAQTLEGFQKGLDQTAAAIEGLSSVPRRLAEIEGTIGELRARR
jgi:ABC-type transporter Mla subunit MlaD